MLSTVKTTFATFFKLKMHFTFPPERPYVNVSVLSNAALLAHAVIIKLTRRGDGGIKEGGIGEGQIGDGGFERIILCSILSVETFRFTVPSPVALLN